MLPNILAILLIIGIKLLLPYLPLPVVGTLGFSVVIAFSVTDSLKSIFTLVGVVGMTSLGFPLALNTLAISNKPLNGSIGCPLRLTSKCKCAPVPIPLLPIGNKNCPPLTFWPLDTPLILELFKWAYLVLNPLPWFTSTKLPYPLPLPIYVTTPSAAIAIGWLNLFCLLIPEGIKSTPLWNELAPGVGGVLGPNLLVTVPVFLVNLRGSLTIVNPSSLT